MFLEPTGTKFVSNEGNSVSYSWKQPEPLKRLKLMTDYSVRHVIPIAPVLVLKLYHIR